MTTPARAGPSRRSASQLSGRRAASQRPAASAASTTTVTTAARATYIRCSLATASIGIRLDVGARARKNSTPGAAQACRRSVPAAVTATSSPTVRNAGQTSANDSATGQLA